jgi:AcrR family transcriptional regulator
MARPVNADAGATRARILENAFSLFAEQGLSNTSIRDVAKGAGVTLATVHHYFGSKDELWNTCIDEMYAQLSSLGTLLEDQFNSGRSAEEVIEHAVVAGYRFSREHRVATRLLVRATVEAGVHSPKGRVLLFAFLDLATQGLSRLTGRKPESLRLPLQSLLFLVSRYAVHDEADLAEVAHVAPEAASAAVEQHLVTIALNLLGAPRPLAH